MPAYVVEHSMVGVHRQGDVIEFTKDHTDKQGVDVKRLLRLGAIREAEKDEADRAVTYGQTDEDVPRVFPTVPFEATPPEPSSPDPLRSESPPTLPEAGVPNETTPIKGRVSEKPRPAQAKP